MSMQEKPGEQQAKSDAVKFGEATSIHRQFSVGERGTMAGAELCPPKLYVEVLTPFA